MIFLRARSGRYVPVNAETVEPGDEQFDAKRHVSHFSDCDNPEKFRRAR